MANNVVRARVALVGTRPLLQHAFGPESIALEKGEKTGVAGNDPEEWKKSCLIMPDGQLYVRGNYAFSCIRAGSKNIKKGRGSIQGLVAATLQIEEPIILIDRHLPAGGPKMDPTNGGLGLPVYIDVTGVRNPATKGRNIRYRLACSPGWKVAFHIEFDKTMVSRDQMRAAIIDAGRFAGLGDGLSVGNGRFAIESYEELTDAEEAPAEGSLGESAPDRVAKGRKKVSAVQGNGAA